MFYIITMFFAFAALLMEKTPAASSRDFVNCSDVENLMCPKNHPYVYNDTSGHTDGSVCVGDSCPTCLEGPEWEPLLAELGKGRANRTLILRMFIGNWVSSELLHTIATILLQDTMGFHVNNFNVGFIINDLVCCKQVPDEFLFLLESWRSHLSHPDITTLQVGYNGMENLYVPQHTLDKYPLMGYYQNFKYLPAYGHVVGKAFSTPCEDLKQDKGKPCESSNFLCNMFEEQLQLTCQQGRFVPPQCQGENAKYCQEIM